MQRGEKTTIMESLINLPLGYRFDPLDRELIQYYLIPKVEHDSSFDCHGVITEADVFGLEPENLARKARYVPGDGNIYFFADRTLKSNRGTAKRAKRTITLADGNDGDGGRWVSRDRPHPVFNQEGEQIGTKRTLTYYKNNETKKTSWRIHEYTLEVKESNKKSHSSSSSSLLGKRKGDGFLDHVICRLFLQPAETCSRKQLQKLLEEEPCSTTSNMNQQCLPNQEFQQQQQHTGGMEAQFTSYHQYPLQEQQQLEHNPNPSYSYASVEQQHIGGMEAYPTTFQHYPPPQAQQTQTETHPNLPYVYPEQQQLDELNAQSMMQSSQSYTDMMLSEFPDFGDGFFP